MRVWRSDNSRFLNKVATGGSSNGDQKVKRFAERVAPVAQTTHPTRAGLAWLLNSLVVPPFLRRGNLWGLCGCSTRLWCHPFCDAGICGARAVAQLACGSSHDHYARTTCALRARYLLRGTIFRSPLLWQLIYCVRTNSGGMICQNCFRNFGRER